MHAHMLDDYVQLGAHYDRSRRAVATVERAHDFIKTMMNAHEMGEVAFGPSTSALCAMLADTYGRCPRAGRDEIVIGEAGHEANIAPWVKLSDRGYRPRFWKVDPGTGESSLEELEFLVGPRTRLVAIHHVSNILGRIEELEAITRIAHAAGAKVVVDGVAYAPHRAMDVAAWGVDWYVFSTYKVYGPHMAVLFGRFDAFEELEGPNFYFVDGEDLTYKFELGGSNHESCAGLLGLREYLAFLAGVSPEGLNREALESAWGCMARLEQGPQARLLAFLAGHPDVRLIGPASSDEVRVPTVSAHRLARALDLDPDDGVVRISLVHYNDEQEVQRLIEFLNATL
jgi:selenocysteine lyase/cysteine desulfurase